MRKEGRRERGRESDGRRKEVRKEGGSRLHVILTAKKNNLIVLTAG
jgi:hypothetical protein